MTRSKAKKRKYSGVKCQNSDSPTHGVGRIFVSVRTVDGRELADAYEVFMLMIMSDIVDFSKRGFIRMSL